LWKEQKRKHDEKAPARESDKQQMQAPNMGEIKKRRSERWKVTTGGGDYATEMEQKIGEKRNNHASANMQNQFL
jgi:hypothetical protein